MRSYHLLPCLLLLGLTQVAQSKTFQFIDQDRASIESVATKLCSLTKGVDNQIGQVRTIHQLAVYFRDLPAKHKLSSCRHKYFESIRSLDELVEIGKNTNACGEKHLERIEEFHRLYVSKVSKHVKYRKANHLAAPWLLVVFFAQYSSAVSDHCETRAASSLKQEVADVEKSREFVEVENLLKQFTDALGMNTDRMDWSKDVFLIWNLVDNLPLERSKKFRKYLTDGEDRLFIRTKEADQIINLQRFCSNRRVEYKNSLLPLIRLADLGYFRGSASKLDGIASIKRFYMIVQMCETLLPIRVLEGGSDLTKPGQIVLLPVEEGQKAKFERFSAHKRPIKDDLSPVEPFKLAIRQDTAANDAARLMEAMKQREKTLKRMVKVMAKNVGRKMKSKAKLFSLSNGKETKDYGPLVESSLKMIEEDENLSELDGPTSERRLMRNKRGLNDFFNAWKDLALNIIDGIAFTIGFVFLFAVKVALVFIVFIYRIGRSITGVGYRPIEGMFEYVWNGGFHITRNALNLDKHHKHDSYKDTFKDHDYKHGGDHFHNGHDHKHKGDHFHNGNGHGPDYDRYRHQSDHYNPNHHNGRGESANVGGGLEYEHHKQDKVDQYGTHKKRYFGFNMSGGFRHQF